MSDEPEVDFMHEGQAPFASPVLSPVLRRLADDNDEPANLDELLDDELGERDTEPNIDAQILRDALRRGLK